MSDNCARRENSRDREPGEVGLSGQHEPRDPDPERVIGMADVADTDLNDEQRAYIDTIRSSGEALLVIINDVLDYKDQADKVSFDRPSISSDASTTSCRCCSQALMQKRCNSPSTTTFHADNPHWRRGPHSANTHEPRRQRGQVHRERSCTDPRGGTS